MEYTFILHLLFQYFQEEIVLELYNNALRAQAHKEYDKSADILTQLLRENISQLENNGGLPKSMSTLKYSCHVNLGNIYLNQGNINQALESFTSVSFKILLHLRDFFLEMFFRHLNWILRMLLYGQK